MERRRRAAVLTFVFTLSGCQSVKLQFVPATAAPAQGNDPSQIAKQASDGYSYFALAADYVLVAPTAKGGAGQPKPSSNSAVAAQQPSGTSTNAPTGTTGTTNGSTPATNSNATTSTNNPANSHPTAAGRGAHTSARAGAHGAHSDTTSRAATGDKDSGSKPSGSDGKPTTGSPSTPTNGTNANTTPPSLDNPLATTTIDNQSWTATAVPMADSNQAYFVKGVSGFWESTTLGVGRYQNSDLVSSLSVTAQNLVPTRIGQIGGAIASIVTIAGALGVSGGASATPLTPFYFKVPDAESSDNVNDDKYWTYTFKFDSGQPAGTVTLTQWKALVAGKTVNYWPVPACRNATLTLTNGDLALKHQAYQFQLVVASQQYVRLEPLPVSGKMELGTICGSSTNGTTTVDTLGNATDDLSALQKAIQQIKTAKSGKNAAGSSSQ